MKGADCNKLSDKEIGLISEYHNQSKYNTFYKENSILKFANDLSCKPVSPNVISRGTYEDLSLT